uniref:Salicylate hydroxylase n=1 Tax=Talaromyces marneffei PM1 TaxID=1077442 RepID=A0A093VHS7_TALMA
MASKTTESTDSHPFEISIIGSGIIGLNLALGLLQRNIPITIYEQAQELKEIGTGIGFSANLEKCITELDPRISAVLHKIGLRQHQSLQWVVASNTEEDFTFAGRVFEAWEEVGGVEQKSDTGKVVMSFMDGTKIETDAVIGCDGIKSRVRYLLAGDNNPAGIPHYANESAYRCLVEMHKVSPILGNYASVMTLWIGHGANLVTYPISNNRFFNVAAFVRDNTGYWPDYSKQTVQASKAEIIDSFSSFNPMLRRLIEALPDEQNRWGMFDTLDHPLDSYVEGCVAVAGDAAHASTPHHGMGAGMGIEDAIVLVTVLEKAKQELSSYTAGTPTSRKIVLSRAFETFDSTRRERSQWLVASSRRQGLLNQWEVPEVRNTDDFLRDTAERVSNLYNYDWRLMVQRSIEDYEQRLAQGDEKIQAAL